MTDNITAIFNGVPRVVRTRERSGIDTQIVEHDRSTPIMYLDLNATGTVVLGSAAILSSWEWFNDDSGIVYVKAYNKATAPTSSDTPKLVWRVMPGASLPGEVLSGLDFPLGLGLRATTGRAHNDNTAPTANSVMGNVGYRVG